MDGLGVIPFLIPPLHQQYLGAPEPTTCVFGALLWSFFGRTSGLLQETSPRCCTRFSHRFSRLKKQPRVGGAHLRLMAPAHHLLEGQPPGGSSFLFFLFGGGGFWWFGERSKTHPRGPNSRNRIPEATHPNPKGTAQPAHPTQIISKPTPNPPKVNPKPAQQAAVDVSPKPTPNHHNPRQ